MRQILLFCLLLVIPLNALADGMVIPTIAYPAKVTIPDQRALICFSNGTERLVIETRFTGSGTNFAWVIPLPGRPVIERTTTGLFPTLQYLFRPQIIHDVPHYYAGILALIGIGYLLFCIRPTGQLRWPDILACICVGAGAAAASHREIFSMGVFLFVATVLFCSVVLIRIGRSSALLVLGLVFLGFFCLTSLFLPTLAFRGISRTVSEEQVSILDRKIVGVFETTTVASPDPKALQTWLSENGYWVPTNSEPVIARYVKDGWVFVAAKVRRNRTALDTSTPHPLSFTFKTDKPVYPMRLTGLGDQPLSVELYVFSTACATAPHFKVKSCTRPDIVYPLLREWTTRLSVATKLSATLLPADMRNDVWLEQVPFVSAQKTRLFSRQGALVTALNLGMVFFAVGLLAVCILAFIGKLSKKQSSHFVGVVTVASVVLAGLSYLCLPKTEVKLVKGFFHIYQREQATVLRLAIADLQPKTIDEARRELRDLISHPTKGAPYDMTNWENYYVGGQVHEEDSPGNYLLRETNHQLQLVIFNADGSEEINAWDLAHQH